MVDPLLTWGIVVGVWLACTWRWGYQSGVRAERARAAPQPPPEPWRPPEPTVVELPDLDALSPAAQEALDGLVAMGVPEHMGRRAVRASRAGSAAEVRQDALRSLIN